MNNWINVNDRLPDIEESYLVYPYKYSFTAEYHKYGEMAGSFTLTNEMGYESKVGVTHWQHRPEDPDKEEQKSNSVISNIKRRYSTEEIIKELKDCDRLDDAIALFSNAS